jgi:hypothetical protein
MRIQVNFTINQETDDGLGTLAKKTFRSKGQVIDWLVAAALGNQFSDQPSVSVETPCEPTTTLPQ